MIDSRFYECAGALSLEELASVSEAKLHLSLPFNKSTSRMFKDVATLEEAQPTDITFFHNPRYRETFYNTQAGVCFIEPKDVTGGPAHTALLVSDTPLRSFALALTALYPFSEEKMMPMTGGSSVHKTAEIASDTVLEPHVMIKEGVKIGTGCYIGANTVIGAGVVIGDRTRIGSNVTITHALIGQKVIIDPGVRIGQAGFGFAMDDKGFITIPQLGRVIIEDRVEIGANTTIDRGSLRDTVIGEGSRLDNLVMIGHNVVLGKGCVLVAQVGIAGSTTLGNHVVVAGQAGLAGHLKIGDFVRIGAQSGVMHDIEAGEKFFGSPAVPMKEFVRRSALVNRLGKRKS